jgi:glycosyltransferase involved in cell wall biosynthesis
MTTYLVDASSYNSEGRPFGVGRYAHFLALAFERIKGELAADERMLAACRLRGDNAVTADLRLERFTDPTPMKYGPYNRGRKAYLSKTIEAARPDLVHFVEGPQVLPLREPAIVATCHDLIPILNPEHYLRGRYRRFKRRLRDYLSYHRARRVIAISEATAGVLVEHLRVPRERITVVPQGVDHERFHAAAPPAERDAVRRAHGLPRRYALYVGATDARKRVDLLIDSYRQVYRATGVPLALVGVEFGRPRPAAARAMRAAVPGSIVAVGGVSAEQLPPLYRHADLHVLPSIYEGFGLTVLEAMACGCPVITTGGGALREVGGDAVRYVAPDRGRDLEEAIVDLLGDAAARDRLRMRGLERAGGFTWDRTARETLAVYRRAAGRFVAGAAGGIVEHRAGEHRQQP